MTRQGETMPRIVVAGHIPESGLALLREVGNVWDWRADDPIPVDELHGAIKGAHAVVAFLTTRIDETFLDAAGPQLRVVANVAVGFNNIDVAACARRGVIATNTPGVLTEATADIAMALILMSTRRLAEGERLIRSAEPWRFSMFMMLGTGIQGRRLGIIGMGAIGQALARRARAFGMTIVYCNRNRLAASVEESLGNAACVEFDELLETSDIVSLNCPYTPQTHHLIDTKALAQMKKTAYLVNTARGPIVDEAALAHALREGHIAGAGLDVYENEPDVHPLLRTLDNAVLIPHLGSATVETRNAMAELAARNVIAVLSGEPALTPIVV